MSRARSPYSRLGPARRNRRDARPVGSTRRDVSRETRRPAGTAPRPSPPLVFHVKHFAHCSPTARRPPRRIISRPGRPKTFASNTAPRPRRSVPEVTTDLRQQRPGLVQPQRQPQAETHTRQERLRLAAAREGLPTSNSCARSNRLPARRTIFSPAIHARKRRPELADGISAVPACNSRVRGAAASACQLPPKPVPAIRASQGTSAMPARIAEKACNSHAQAAATTPPSPQAGNL